MLEDSLVIEDYIFSHDGGLVAMGVAYNDQSAIFAVTDDCLGLEGCLAVSPNCSGGLYVA